MHILTLNVTEGTGNDAKVVSTRKFNLDELVCATCEGTTTDNTDLVLVFSNGDAIRIPFSEKESVLEKIAAAEQDSGDVVRKDPSIISDAPDPAENLNGAIAVANKCLSAIKAMMTMVILAFTMAFSSGCDNTTHTALEYRSTEPMVVRLGSASTNTMFFTAAGVTNYVSIMGNPNLLYIKPDAIDNGTISLSTDIALYTFYTSDGTFPGLLVPSDFGNNSFYAFELEWKTPSSGLNLSNQVTWLSQASVPTTVVGNGTSNGVYRIALRYRGDTQEFLGNPWMTYAEPAN